MENGPDCKSAGPFEVGGSYPPRSTKLNKMLIGGNVQYEYYKHKSRGYVDNHFGRIGEPVKINFVEYIWRKITGFRVTKVLEGTSKTEVVVTAAINDGTHPKSYKVQKIRELGYDE